MFAASSKPLLYHLPLGRTTYSRASLIQESLVTLHLAHRTLGTALPPLPPPTVITCEFSPPVYTSGLRQHTRIPAAQKAFLTGTAHPTTGERAEFVEARRGGQMTWHGRGQCTMYPVADLRALRVGARDWVHLLEGVTIGVLRGYGVAAADRDRSHPGVWARGSKIAAVGLRVRSAVVNHGVAVNVDTDGWWWARVVACGIAGRGVTDLKREMPPRPGVPPPGVDEVGAAWVAELAGRLGRTVRVVRVEEVLGWGWEERFAGTGGDGL
ncbi:hypothetical protein EV426DRAFT_541505 [Tirmania nivea]|nr:hypothetical protein EV426DRAFT_541505 [Tirmania nivea]